MVLRKWKKVILEETSFDIHIHAKQFQCGLQRNRSNALLSHVALLLAKSDIHSIIPPTPDAKL